MSVRRKATEHPDITLLAAVTQGTAGILKAKLGLQESGSKGFVMPKVSWSPRQVWRLLRAVPLRPHDESHDRSVSPEAPASRSDCWPYDCERTSQLSGAGADRGGGGRRCRHGGRPLGVGTGRLPIAACQIRQSQMVMDAAQVWSDRTRCSRACRKSAIASDNGPTCRRGFRGSGVPP